MKNKARSIAILIGGWSFALATMYMAASVLTDPKHSVHGPYSRVKLGLILLLIILSIIGLILSYMSKKDVKE